MSERLAVSACLLSWKRPRNVQLIARALHELEFFDEVLIWNNNPSIRLEVPGTRTRVFSAEDNVSCYGRFLCAKRARNPVIYVQDDDVLISGIPDLYARFLADRNRIAHALSAKHYADRERQMHGDCHVALLGWGALFMKDWVRVLDEVPKDLRRGRIFLREADKFFVILLERRHNTALGKIRWLADHATEGIALWRQADHWECKGLAVREALRMVRLRRASALPSPWHVVITCHNYGRYLGDAAASVFRNDADYELTIVDDASSDETPDVVQNLR